jgi:elongation factor 1-beta
VSEVRLSGPLSAILVGNVLVTLKIFPNSVELDRTKLREQITEACKPPWRVIRIDDLPIAYGFTALRANITIPEDTEGGTEGLEQVIQKLPGVSSVEVELVNRM